MQVNMPNAFETEQSLLGTLISFETAPQTAIESGLRSDHFYTEVHQKLFDVIESMYEAHEQIDLMTVINRLKDLNLLEALGGEVYILELANKGVSSYNTKSYVNIIIDKAQTRRMIQVCENIASKGYSGVVNINDYLDEAEKSVLEIAKDRRSDEFKDIKTVLSNVMELISKRDGQTVTGIKTGFSNLDDITHGFQRGDFIIIAARPSMGKTAVALNFASEIAKRQDGAVAIFSLEMGAEQLIERILSFNSRVAISKLKTGNLTANENVQLQMANKILRNTKMFIDDTSSIRVSEIFSKCRKLQAEHGLSAIFIDYIQLISGNSRENRQQEVSEISRNLKILARELNVPVIALSQLSRSVESRSEKRPMMSDLRESGAIEQDADIIMLLYRDAYYNKDTENAKSPVQQLDVDIAKHRNGKTAVIQFGFESETNTLYTAAPASIGENE